MATENGPEAGPNLSEMPETRKPPVQVDIIRDASRIVRQVNRAARTVSTCRGNASALNSPRYPVPPTNAFALGSARVSVDVCTIDKYDIQ